MSTSKELQCTVVSFVPFELLETKPGLIPPAFLIEKSDGVTPTILHVGAALWYMYVDETRGSIPMRGPSDLVAESLVNDYATSQLGVDEFSGPGIFWVPGEYNLAEIKIKFPEELKKALDRQHNWFQNCCRIADDVWSKDRRHVGVSDSQRLMANMLGLESKDHPWMSAKKLTEMARCNACYSTLNDPKQTVCHVCKASLVEPELATK